MKLHKILSAVGFLLWLTGVAMLDSERASIQVAMIAVGLIITILTAYEDGAIGRKGRWKRIVYTCDRCRKEITGNPHRMFIECVDRETGDFQQETVHPEVGQMDLCKDCTDFLAGLVMRHVEKGAPVVVNEDFEKAVEDMVATSQQDKPVKKAKPGQKLDTGKVRAVRNAVWTVKNIAIEVNCSEMAIYNALKEIGMPEKGKAPGTEVHEGNQQSSKL